MSPHKKYDISVISCNRVFHILTVYLAWYSIRLQMNSTTCWESRATQPAFPQQGQAVLLYRVLGVNCGTINHDSRSVGWQYSKLQQWGKMIFSFLRNAFLSFSSLGGRGGRYKLQKENN